MTDDERTAERAGRQQTVRFADWVYGEHGVDPADPAELYHEASKLLPRVADHRTRARLLQTSTELQTSALRSVKRNPQLPTIPLPRADLRDVALADAIRRRSSERAFAADPLQLAEVSTLLAAAYGVTREDGASRQRLRAVPSGGALYPLDLYVAARAVSGLERALYRFDPLRRVLERVRTAEPERELAALSPYSDALTGAAAVLFVTAMFWRTRFKYGLRGYRFALLEAGHVGQNVLLAAAALGLAAVPIGGFFDRRADRFLDVDGVNESCLYLVPVGRPAPA